MMAGNARELREAVEWRLPMPDEGFDYYLRTFALLETAGSFAVPGATISSMTRCGPAHQWGTFTMGAAESSERPPSTECITACVMTCESEATLAACLSSIRPWADRLLVIDSGSQDATLDIAAQYADEVLQREWPGCYACQRNFILGEVRSEWMIMIDSDEVVQASFGAALRSYLTAANELDLDVLWLPRLWVTAFDEPTGGEGRVAARCRSGHWYFHPDPQARVARMAKAPRYRGSLHEVLELGRDGRGLLLTAPALALVHLRLLATPPAVRRAQIAERNRVDPEGVHNQQLLTEGEPDAALVRHLAFDPDVLQRVLASCPGGVA